MFWPVLLGIVAPIVLVYVGGLAKSLTRGELDKTDFFLGTDLTLAVCAAAVAFGLDLSKKIREGTIDGAAAADFQSGIHAFAGAAGLLFLVVAITQQNWIEKRKRQGKPDLVYGWFTVSTWYAIFSDLIGTSLLALFLLFALLKG